MQAPFVPALDPTEVYKGLQVGAGNFGVVYKGTYNGEEVAIKTGTPITDVIELHHILAELQTMAACTHQNVVKLHGYYVEGDVVSIVMELCKMDLSELLERGSSFSEKLRIAGEIAAGLAYLHEQEILHRDIKPSNILIAADNSIRVADFGLARFDAGSIQSLTVCGTPFYMAPEILHAWFLGQGRARYNRSVDVYSLGKLLARDLFGAQELRAHPLLAQLIELACNEEPSQRTTARQLHQRLLFLAEQPLPSPPSSNGSLTVRYETSSFQLRWDENMTGAQLRSRVGEHFGISASSFSLFASDHHSSREFHINPTKHAARILHEIGITSSSIITVIHNLIEGENNVFHK